MLPKTALTAVLIALTTCVSALPAPASGTQVEQSKHFIPVVLKFRNGNNANDKYRYGNDKRDVADAIQADIAQAVVERSEANDMTIDKRGKKEGKLAKRFHFWYWYSPKDEADVQPEPEPQPEPASK
ncbi:hypothetical protein AJ79_03450 [Helicocarpus griseus UAMH5409]|uniref:RxLR effector protein n=1 Tax=Helicocarpus griseus UAMH5409 TaxID=1447875 RepID=A0A2B7XYA0_9EURO|nr:hypothetical protein AJ79_03450 [Helicocarpus griseus UAMH5409]